MNLDRLKEIREDKDIGQSKMADILGISRTYYANCENGIKIITLDKLNIFINYFDVSFDYILMKTNKRNYSDYAKIDFIDYKYLGSNIRKYREVNNLSQLDLAGKINTSQVAISKYESGHIKISTNNLCKMAQIFKISIDELIRPKIDKVYSK